MGHPWSRAVLEGRRCQPATRCGGHQSVLDQVSQVRWQLYTEGNPCQVGGTGCGLLYLLGMPWDASTPAVLGRSCSPASQSCCSASPASVCSQKTPITGASSALRDCKKTSPNSGKMERKPPHPRPCLRQAGGVVRAHFHYRKLPHPRRRGTRSNVQGLMQKH